MTNQRTIVTDIEHSQDLMIKHSATVEHVLTGHPDAYDIYRALDGWRAASQIVEVAHVPAGAMTALKCIATSIYAMGYKRGKHEANLPVFVVRDPEALGEGL